jgi:hypothetical protein
MDVWDLAILVGIAAAAYGLLLLSTPAAIIFLGLVFMAIGFIGSRASFMRNGGAKRGP